MHASPLPNSRVFLILAVSVIVHAGSESMNRLLLLPSPCSRGVSVRDLGIALNLRGSAFHAEDTSINQRRSVRSVHLRVVRNMILPEISSHSC